MKPAAFIIIYPNGATASAKGKTAAEALAKADRAAGEPIGILQLDMIVTPAVGATPLQFVPLFSQPPETSAPAE